MKKDFKKAFLSLALSTSMVLGGNGFGYLNTVYTVQAEDVTASPVMTDPNHASIADAPFNKPGYALDPNTNLKILNYTTEKIQKLLIAGGISIFSSFTSLIVNSSN